VADDEIVAALRSIDRRLALLTGPQERALRATLLVAILNTEPRKKMFDAIDGVKGNPELATAGGVTPRAAQNFVNQLLELGLVRSVGTGRDIVVARDEDGVVQWYLRWASEEDERPRAAPTPAE
jgi:hypothetical protein